MHNFGGKLDDGICLFSHLEANLQIFKKSAAYGLGWWKSIKNCTSCHESFEPKQPKFVVKRNQPKTSQKPLFTLKFCETTSKGEESRGFFLFKVDPSPGTFLPVTGPVGSTTLGAAPQPGEVRPRGWAKSKKWLDQFMFVKSNSNYNSLAKPNHFTNRKSFAK